MLQIDTAENGRYLLEGTTKLPERDLQPASERRRWRAKEIA
jgi:hypothetical protein